MLLPLFDPQRPEYIPVDDIVRRLPRILAGHVLGHDAAQQVVKLLTQMRRQAQNVSWSEKFSARFAPYEQKARLCIEYDTGTGTTRRVKYLRKHVITTPVAAFLQAVCRVPRGIYLEMQPKENKQDAAQNAYVLIGRYHAENTSAETLLNLLAPLPIGLHRLILSGDSYSDHAVLENRHNNPRLVQAADLLERQGDLVPYTAGRRTHLGALRLPDSIGLFMTSYIDDEDGWKYAPIFAELPPE